jgi:glycerophosphoryl diester phosphodiesterase
LSAPIYEHSYQELAQAQFLGEYEHNASPFKVASLRELLESIGGRVGLELEIKGPEPEAPQVIGNVLHDYRSLWYSLEVTSYEPQLLRLIQQACPGIVVDLLYPRSEAWKGLDVVAYEAIQIGRLAGARAVHLHPNQLSSEVVRKVRQSGLEVHAWDVNDEQSLRKVLEHQIPKMCTDRLKQAHAYRSRAEGKPHSDP